jgi:hypothetical protein
MRCGTRSHRVPIPDQLEIRIRRAAVAESVTDLFD